MELLDDTSPCVQRALLDEFQKHGPAAALFLRQIADGPNRILSFYARWYLTELWFSGPHCGMAARRLPEKKARW